MARGKGEWYLGSHAPDNGGIDMAARRAGRAGMKALQIFTAPPRFYGDRSGVRPERVERFRVALREAGIDPAKVVVHGAYVLGVATPEAEKWERARAGLTKELERSTTLGVGAVCFHPGSAGNSTVEEAAERAGRAIASALEAVDGTTRLLVENTAGAGRTLGRTAEEIAAILSHVPPALRGRAGYGLDTCHLFASGYDITASEEALRRVLDDFEGAVGEPPSFFHLNDSEAGLGTNRDRHARIGQGEIGRDPFGWLLRDPRSRGIPLILETPHQNPDVPDDDSTPDPWEVEAMEVLKGMI